MTRRVSRRSLVVGLVAVVLAVSGCGGSGDDADGGDAPDETTAEVDGLPERVPGLDGGTVALSVPGRPSVVAFVAAWCAPCHVELPQLQELHERLGDEVTFVAVAVEEEVAATRGLIEETGVEFPVGLDEDGEVLMAAGIAGLPGTILLDAEGNVARELSGSQSGAEIEAELQPLLAEG